LDVTEREGSLSIENENTEFASSGSNETTHVMDSDVSITTTSDGTKCTSQCCSSYEKAFQPVDKAVLESLSSKGRKFLPQWYKQFPWLNVCTKIKAVFCLYCCYSCHHNLNQFT